MSSFIQQQPLILASSSEIRIKLLKSLGVQFQIIPSHCDEESFKAIHLSDDVVDLGFTLAQAKALKVSQLYPEHFIIAADQLCVFDDKILDKPLNHQTAIKHLQLLSGKKHQQIACMCIAQGNKILWQHHERAELTVRDLSDKEINAYLLCEKPYYSCGAYQFESQGKWLFSSVQGHEDTILGLALLPLAHALIQLGVVRF